MSDASNEPFLGTQVVPVKTPKRARFASLETVIVLMCFFFLSIKAFQYGGLGDSEWRRPTMKPRAKCPRNLFLG